MKILIIGSGGREHALAWKIQQSPLATKLYAAPGNGGIAEIAECVNIALDDLHGLVLFAKEQKIDLTVIGPEAPLAAGLSDLFANEGLKVFGPSGKAAQLEGSKVFAKKFMQECNIPTAPFKVFNNHKTAVEFIKDAQYPLVVKADGLAAGKGVVICEDSLQARQALDRIMEDKVFQDAGKQVVVEECLKGEEASILAICDGDHYVILESSQDHKRIFDDDLGPNTGGMGAYSPAPIIDSEILKKIESRVIDPAVRGMKRNGTPFQGVLYAGLMIVSGQPMVLEFNVRFGDPEIQAILPRLKNDLVELLFAACEKRLEDYDLFWDSRPCVCVVMSSGGYPGKYDKGMEITGLEDVSRLENTVVFHAGTKITDGRVVTNGGRVLGVTALGKDVAGAIDTAYEAVEKIHFDHRFFRRDIGARALDRQDGEPAIRGHK